jgi:hypothetical protein
MDPAGLIVSGVGALLICWGAVPSQWAEKRHAAKLKARMDRGHDKYHDELRALQTYTPKQRRLILFGIGGVLLATGLNGLLRG